MNSHEIFFNEKFSFDHFHIFDSLYYIHISKKWYSIQSTWNDEIMKDIIVKYLSITLYEYYDLIWHKFDIKYNIIIHENEFIESQDLNQFIFISLIIFIQLFNKSLDSLKLLYDMIII